MRLILFALLLSLTACDDEGFTRPGAGGQRHQEIEGTWLWVRTLRENTGQVLEEANPNAPVYWYFDDRNELHQIQIDHELAKGPYRVEMVPDVDGTTTPILFTEMRPGDENRYHIDLHGERLDELDLTLFEARPRLFEFVLFREGPPRDDWR